MLSPFHNEQLDKFINCVSVAPKIDRNALHDIRVRAGSNFDLDVPVAGEPPPTKKWSLNGMVVTSTERLKITIEDYNIKFAVRSAKREDTGTYTLTATNEHGTDSATVKVTVLGTNLYRLNTLLEVFNFPDGRSVVVRIFQMFPVLQKDP